MAPQAIKNRQIKRTLTHIWLTGIEQTITPKVVYTRLNLKKKKANKANQKRCHSIVYESITNNINKYWIIIKHYMIQKNIFDIMICSACFWGSWAINICMDYRGVYDTSNKVLFKRSNIKCFNKTWNSTFTDIKLGWSL